jgi:hypothetical protein
VTSHKEGHEDDPISLYASKLHSTRHKPLTPRRVTRKQCTDSLHPVISCVDVNAVETSDQEEKRLLTQQSSRDYWLCADPLTICAPSTSLHSCAAVSPPYTVDSRPYELSASFVAGGVARSNSSAISSAASDAHFTPMSSRAVIAPIGSSDNESYSSETSSRKRVLRPRKRIQLQPYTMENASYRTTLKLRGQKDAIVRLKDIRSGHQFSEYESWRQTTPRSADSADDSEFEDGQSYTHQRSSSLLSRTDHVPVSDVISERRQNKHGRPPDRVTHTEDADSGRYLASPSSVFSSTVKFLPSNRKMVQATSPALLRPALPSSMHDSQSASSSFQSSSDKESVGRRAEAKQRKALQRMFPRVVIKQLETEQDWRNQNFRLQSNRKTPTPTSVSEYSVAMRGEGTIHRVAKLRRTPIRVMGDPDSQSDITDASGHHSEAVLLTNDISSNEQLRVPGSFLRETDEGRHLRPPRPSLAASPQDRSLIDRMLSKPRRPAFPRSTLDRNYDALHISMPTYEAAVQDSLKGDSTSSSAQLGAPPSGFEMDMVPARRNDRPSTPRRDHPTNICILEGHSNSYQTSTGRSTKPVSIAVRLIFVTYQLRVVTLRLARTATLAGT